MDLSSYLNRDVFERLYNTPTTASEMQKIEGSPDGTPLRIIPPPMEPSNLFPEKRITPRKRPTKLDLIQGGRSPTGIMIPHSHRPRTKRRSQIPTSRKSPSTRARTSSIPTPRVSTPRRSPAEAYRSRGGRTPREQQHLRHKRSNSIASSITMSSEAIPESRSFDTFDTPDQDRLPLEENILNIQDPPALAQARELFAKLDSQHDQLGLLSLEELDKGISRLYPSFGTQPRAVQAYRSLKADATQLVDATEFPFVLLFLMTFRALWDEFVFLDESDLGISRGEFVEVAERLGFFADVEATFNGLDSNDTGMVPFEEFCALCCTVQLEMLLEEEGAMGPTRSDDTSSVASGTPRSTSELMDMFQNLKTDSRDTTSVCEQGITERKANDHSIPALSEKETSELLAMFDALDKSSKGTLTLAEMEAFIAKEKSHWNRKHAILRSYQEVDHAGDGLVHRSEFPHFIKFLQLYNNVWATFSAEEIDHRLSFSDFEHLVAGKDIDAQQVFGEIDQNEDGYIFFDEFCAFQTKKMLSTPMTDHLPTTIDIPSNDGVRDTSQDQAREENASDVKKKKIYIPADSDLIRLFDTLDKGKMGNLAIQEIVSFFSKQRRDPQHQETVLKAFRTANHNHDIVRRGRFPFLCRYMMYLNRRYGELDVNSDKLISIPDCSLIASEFGAPVTSDQLFEEVYANELEHGVTFQQLCGLLAKFASDGTRIDDDDDDNEQKVIADARQGGVPVEGRKKLQPVNELLAIFDNLDPNGRGMLSFNEVSKYILEFQPQWNRQSSIMRAFKVADRNDDGFLHRSEFQFFCRLIDSYTKFWDPSRQISKNEFAMVAWKLGVKDVDTTFAELDSQDLGYIRFDQFTDYKDRTNKMRGANSSSSCARPFKSEEVDVFDRQDAARLETLNLAARISIRDLVGENPFVSFIEFKGVNNIEQYIQKHHPEWYNPIAIKCALQSVDDQEGDIRQSRVPFFIHFLVLYHALALKYSTICANGDRWSSKWQFLRVCSLLRVPKPETTFERMDPNEVGFISFTCLCSYFSRIRVLTNGGTVENTGSLEGKYY